MDDKLFPAPHAIRLVQEMTEGRIGADVMQELADNHQETQRAYAAWKAQAEANDASVAAAARRAGPGFDAMAILRGWPYR